MQEEKILFLLFTINCDMIIKTEYDIMLHIVIHRHTVATKYP